MLAPNVRLFSCAPLHGSGCAAVHAFKPARANSSATFDREIARLRIANRHCSALSQQGNGFILCGARASSCMVIPIYNALRTALCVAPAAVVTCITSHMLTPRCRGLIGNKVMMLAACSLRDISTGRAMQLLMPACCAVCAACWLQQHRNHCQLERVDHDDAISPQIHNGKELQVVHLQGHDTRVYKHA